MRTIPIQNWTMNVLGAHGEWVRTSSLHVVVVSADEPQEVRSETDFHFSRFFSVHDAKRRVPVGVIDEWEVLIL